VSGFDGFANGSHLVRAEVVEHDDVAHSERRDESSTNEVKERATVDRSSVCHQARSLTEPYRADERERFPRATKTLAVGPLTTKAPAVLSTHAGLARRFVDEYEA
jgi:hypothetical protein